MKLYDAVSDTIVDYLLHECNFPFGRNTILDCYIIDENDVTVNFTSKSDVLSEEDEDKFINDENVLTKWAKSEGFKIECEYGFFTIFNLY